MIIQEHHQRPNETRLKNCLWVSMPDDGDGDGGGDGDVRGIF